MVVITIIGILAGMVMGAVHMARQAAHEAATKATIAKLNNIIMQRYESYRTRRAPIQIPAQTDPRTAAGLRLLAIRALMQMEMPDSLSDITSVTGTQTISFGGGNAQLAEPALHVLYRNNQPTTTYESAQCLYKIISMGSPEDMEQFNQNEIGTTSDGQPVFIDGWGTPICWLRWAPGFNRPHSNIQSGDADADSDPFDPRRVDYDPNNPTERGYHLIPLICSAGPDKTFGIRDLPDVTPFNRSTILTYNDPYDTAHYSATNDVRVGAPDGTGHHYDNIDNHHIEQR